MKFGFVGAALKAVGKGALAVAETAGPAAATAFGGPLAGTLAKIAIDGIAAAQAKHAAVAPGALVQSTVTGTAVPVNLAKKLDVMSYFESQAGTIASLVLAETGRPVADPARFAQGVDLLVEGLVDVMKSINAIPTASQPVVVSQAIVEPLVVPEAPKSITPVTPAVVPTPFVGVVSNGDPQPAATPVSADVVALLNQVLQRLGPKVTVTP